MNTQSWRADQVGSFLRPAELLDAHKNGASADTVREIEDRHIVRVLAKQKEIGLDIFTDGELRRQNFMSDFVEAVNGFEDAETVARTWDATQGAAPPVSAVTGVVTGKLSAKRRMTQHETEFLKKNSPGAVKVTLPSATQFPAISFKPGISDKVYADRSALLTDIAQIMSDELAKLKTEGVQYIQIDAPRYSYFIDPKWRSWIKNEIGREPESVLDEYLKADNQCFAAARERGVTRAIHLCRGNNRSHWYAEGGYDAIAEKLFHTLDVDRFLLEYDDERSGTFEPLRLVPASKTVVLGLISSKNPELESKDELLQRIDAAAKYIPLERLALSPQCGFASTMEGNLLTEEQQWAKLKLTVEVAKKVWG